ADFLMAVRNVSCSAWMNRSSAVLGVGLGAAWALALSRVFIPAPARMRAFRVMKARRCMDTSTFGLTTGVEIIPPPRTCKGHLAVRPRLRGVPPHPALETVVGPLS